MSSRVVRGMVYRLIQLDCEIYNNLAPGRPRSRELEAMAKALNRC